MRRELVPAFRECTRALRRMDTEWAVGGAEAMAAHGYQRETLDVDLFIGDDARDDLIGALERKNLPVITVLEGVHYAVTPDPKHDEVRIDLLFPSDEPEVTAIWKPVDAVIADEKVPVIRLEYIAASKLLTDPASERGRKDAGDLAELHRRGMIDGPKVLDVLNHCPGRGPAKQRLMDLITGPERSVARRSRRTR
jgi:hypothetical protein